MSDKDTTETVSTNSKKENAFKFDASFILNIAVKSAITSLAISIANAPLSLLGNYVINNRELKFIPFVKNLWSVLPPSVVSGQVRGGTIHVTKGASSASQGKYAEVVDGSIEESWLQRSKYHINSIMANKVVQAGAFSQLSIVFGGYWDNLADLKSHKIHFKQSFVNFRRVLAAGYSIISTSRLVSLGAASQSRDLSAAVLPDNLFSECPAGRKLLGGAVVGTGMAVINYPLSVSHYLLLGKGEVVGEKIHFPSSVTFFKSALNDAAKVGFSKSTKEFLSTAIKVLPMRSLNSVITILVLNAMDDLLGDSPADEISSRFKR